MKRNRCFSALRNFMTTLSENQAGGGQPGVQVASSEWRKVLKFGDGVWPPEPPRSWIPEWVTIPDPTMPACTEDQQVRTKATSWTTTWIQSTATALSIGETTTAEGKTNITIGTIRTECAGPQASGSAGPPTPPPQAAPKPAAKPMPRRETPATDYVPPLTPSNVILYCRALTDYTGTQVRSFLNIRVD